MSSSNHLQTPWSLLKSTISKKQIKNTHKAIQSPTPLPTTSPSASTSTSPIITPKAAHDVSITSNCIKANNKNKVTPEERLCAYYVRGYESRRDPPRPMQPYVALIDSAATHHSLEGKALPHCTHIHAARGPTATVVNGVIISPTYQASIPIVTSLYQSAQHAYVFNDIKTGSLISVGQLCNDGCIAIFS